MTSTPPSTRKSRPVAASPWAFRHARLGPEGWAAVVAPGALAGAGIALTTVHGRAGIGRLAAGLGGGALCGLLLARAIDEVKWRRSAVSLEVDEPDAALDLMQAVRAEGVHADMVRGDDAAGPTRGSYVVRYRAKDDRLVRAVFAEQQG